VWFQRYLLPDIAHVLHRPPCRLIIVLLNSKVNNPYPCSSLPVPTKLSGSAGFKSQSVVELTILPTIRLYPASHTSQAPAYRLNFKLDLQSLFGLLCVQLYSLAEAPQPNHSPSPNPPHLGFYTMALLVSQDRRHLFVTPCSSQSVSE
jgi:hypothetical protein